jgi:hypothetical protein
MKIWHAIDDLEKPGSKGYPERLATFLASMNAPLEEILSLHSEAQKQKAKQYDTRLLAIPIIFILIIGLGVQMDSIAHSGPTLLTFGVVLAETLALVALGHVLFRKGNTRVQEREALWNQRLATIDRIMKPMLRDVNNIGTLLDMIGKSPWTPVQTGYLTLDKNIRAAVIHLLPHISHNHAHHFNSARLNTLTHFLRYRNDQIVTDVLFAMAAVGDRGSMMQIARFAKKRPLNEEQERVQRVAQDCLATLAERLEQEKQAVTLLHPSEQPDSPDSLLRPAKGTDDSDTELLLRSISEDR